MNFDVPFHDEPWYMGINSRFTINDGSRSIYNDKCMYTPYACAYRFVAEQTKITFFLRSGQSASVTESLHRHLS